MGAEGSPGPRMGAESDQLPEWFAFLSWSDRQHYKQRNPPWIKSYGDRLTDYNFTRLSDVSKAHFLCLELLASRHGNLLPADPRWLAQQIAATDPVDLAPLSPFIIRVSAASPADASNLLAKRLRDARPETEAKQRKRKEHSSAICEVDGKYPVGFLQGFWKHYPRKTHKAEAFAAWCDAVSRLGGGGTAVQRIEQAIVAFAPGLRTRPKEFIPYAASWLKAGAYEDPYPAVPARSN